MSEENLQSRPENAENQVAELQTKVLQLERPIWSYGGNRYDANRMSVSIADFFGELKTAGIDRRTNPELARFTTRRAELSPDDPLALQELFNGSLVDSLIREAAARGIDVAVIRGRLAKDNSPYAFRASRFETRAEAETTGLSDRLRAFLGRNRQEPPLPPQTAPDFLLRITLDFHGPETPDYQKDTWSYKELLHTVQLVDPNAEPVSYVYFPYEQR